MWGPRCGDLGVVPTFDCGTLVWGPRCGFLLLIGDLGVGPYLCLQTQVWVPNSWDGSHCKVIVKNYSIIESLETRTW